VRAAFFGHPAGLATVFFNEMWERLSFYGMRALLVLFLVDSVAHGGLGLDDGTATAIYGLYVGATFLACLPGGWIGDRLLGAQRAILAGSSIIALGHLTLGFSQTSQWFYLGLLIIVIGTGLLKPNAGAIVAALYPEGGARRDAGFTIYYVGVNLGATLGPLITGWLAEQYGWRYGFMAAAAGMTIGLLQFVWGRRVLGTAGREPPGTSASWRGVYVGAIVVFATTASLWSGAWSISAPAMRSLSTQGVTLVAVAYFAYLLFGAGLNPLERRRVLAVIVLFIASALFWAGYEQSGSSFNLFAERDTARGLWGFTVPASWLQALNPVFIIALGPVFSALWIRLGLRNLDPSTPIKFIFGLLGIALGFLVMAAAARVVMSGQLAGMGWLTLTYLLHTTAELVVSPVGMSAVSKLVPQRLVGQSMGVWFLSIALGELIAGGIAGDIDTSRPAAMSAQFMQIFWFASFCALGVALLLPLMRRWTAGVK
jgi:proton-dependent oligopeptide transporter, POT family